MHLRHSQLTAVVGEELLLQREAARRAGFDPRGLQKGKADPGLCEKGMRQREGRSHSSEQIICNLQQQLLLPQSRGRRKLGAQLSAHRSGREAELAKRTTTKSSDVNSASQLRQSPN